MVIRFLSLCGRQRPAARCASAASRPCCSTASARRALSRADDVYNQYDSGSTSSRTVAAMFPRHSVSDPAGRRSGIHRLSGSLSRPDRTVVAPLSPVSRRADATRPTAWSPPLVAPRFWIRHDRTLFDGRPCRLHRGQHPCQESCARFIHHTGTGGPATPHRRLRPRTQSPPPCHTTCARPASDDRIPIDGSRCGFVQPVLCLPSRR